MWGREGSTEIPLDLWNFQIKTFPLVSYFANFVNSTSIYVHGKMKLSKWTEGFNSKIRSHFSYIMDNVD